MAERHPTDLEAFEWYPAAGVDGRRLRELVARAARELRQGRARNLRAGRRKQLYRLHLAGGCEADHLLKLNRYAGVGLVRRWSRSKSRRELRRAEAVAARGVSTPLPLAAGESRRTGALEACALLVPVVPGAVDLLRLRECGGLVAAERRELSRRLGELSRQLQAAGVFQEDFAPNNLLVRRGGALEVLPIDFERARLRRWLGRRERRWMLAKLARALGDASLAERWRFLSAYTGGDREAARRWWRTLERFAPRLALRDRRRLERIAARPGRRFRSVTLDGWRGHARRDCSDAVLRAALADSAGTEPVGGKPAQRSGAGGRALRIPALSPEGARRTWAVANALYERRLVGPPLALLCAGSLGIYLAEQRPGERPAAAVERRRLEAALPAFLDRLLLYAELPAGLELDHLAWLAEPGAGRGRVELRDPTRAHITGRSVSARPPTARRLARELLPAPDGGCAPGGNASRR